MPSFLYGRGADLQARMGIDLLLSERLAAIIIFAANIENELERAIWKLRGGSVEPGSIPDTDARPISDLLRMFNEIVAALEPGEQRTMLETWCKAARSGFTIRNNIVHGMTVNFDTKVAFMRNTQWDGFARKRPFGDLWADHDTLDMIRDAFAVLLRVIWGIARDQEGLTENALVPRALRDARSILGEFASQSYNPSFEKY